MTDKWPDESDEWADEPGDQELSDTAIETDVDSKISDDPSGQRLVGLLPDGRRLVLSGAGAGATVFDGADTTAAGPTIRDRDDALASGAPPIMLLHRPHQAAGVIQRLSASIVAATRGGVSLGVAAMLPDSSEATVTRWLSAHPAAALRLADPGCFRMDPTLVRISDLSDRALRWAPYLSQDEIDVGELVDRQRFAGANLFLSSGRALDPTSPQRSLDTVFTSADEALSKLQAGERMALNLTMSTQWLAARRSERCCSPSSWIKSNSTYGTSGSNGQPRLGHSSNPQTQVFWRGTSGSHSSPTTRNVVCCCLKQDPQVGFN